MLTRYVAWNLYWPRKWFFHFFFSYIIFSRSTFTEFAKKRARAVNVHLRKSRSENETQSNSMKSFQLSGLGLSRMSDFERSCLHVLCDYKHPPLVPLLSRVSEVGSKKMRCFYSYQWRNYNRNRIRDCCFKLVFPRPSADVSHRVGRLCCANNCCEKTIHFHSRWLSKVNDNKKLQKFLMTSK